METLIPCYFVANLHPTRHLRPLEAAPTCACDRVGRFSRSCCHVRSVEITLVRRPSPPGPLAPAAVVASNGQILRSLRGSLQPGGQRQSAILALAMARFRYEKGSWLSLVAEEVEKVNPDLVARGEDGKVTA